MRKLDSASDEESGESLEEGSDSDASHSDEEYTDSDYYSEGDKLEKESETDIGPDDDVDPAEMVAHGKSLPRGINVSKNAQTTKKAADKYTTNKGH